MLLAQLVKHRYMGLKTEIISPREIAKIVPLTIIDGIITGLYGPLDGHLNPSNNHRYLFQSRTHGRVIIEIITKVMETNQRRDGCWDVVIDRGTIHTEQFANAAGLWAREVGAMAGIYLPLHPMKRQYIVTD